MTFTASQAAIEARFEEYKLEQIAWKQEQMAKLEKKEKEKELKYGTDAVIMLVIPTSVCMLLTYVRHP